MTDTIWSVNILIGTGILGVVWCIYYILTLDSNEEKANSSDSHSNSSIDE